MKVLDWGEEGLATAAEAAALRTSFRQEVAVWHKLDHPNVTKVRPIYASYVAVNIGRWLCFFSFFFPFSHISSNVTIVVVLEMLL